MSTDPEEEYVPWIQQFCELFGHDYFVPVLQEFIEDDFNLTGLSLQVPYYREALYTILDYEVETSDDTSTGSTVPQSQNVVGATGNTNSSNNNSNSNINANANNGGARKQTKPELPNKSLLSHSAELLYGLIHLRYIILKPGLTAMATKFERNEFGSCPRYYCDGMHLIPVGATDIPGQETVRLYCPCCNDIYLPSLSRYLNIDGAFFGTTFPGLLVQMFPEIENQCRIRTKKLNSLDSGLKLFGFKISELSALGPRMKWLRMYPNSEVEKEEFEKCELGLPSNEVGGVTDSELEDDDEMEDDEDEEEEDDDDKTMASET